MFTCSVSSSNVTSASVKCFFSSVYSDWSSCGVDGCVYLLVIIFFPLSSSPILDSSILSTTSTSTRFSSWTALLCFIPSWKLHDKSTCTQKTHHLHIIMMNITSHKAADLRPTATHSVYLTSGTEGLTLYCTPPPRSSPWARLWFRLWSPPCWLTVWLAPLPAAPLSFHCIVSDRKLRSGLAHNQCHSRRRQVSVTTTWPCFIAWRRAALSTRSHRRRQMTCRTFVSAANVQHRPELTTPAHFVAWIPQERCAWTLSAIT